MSDLTGASPTLGVRKPPRGGDDLRTKHQQLEPRRMQALPDCRRDLSQRVGSTRQDQALGAGSFGGREPHETDPGGNGQPTIAKQIPRHRVLAWRGRAMASENARF